MARYALGLDFGTESGRALLVDVATGEEVASVVVPYAHGVIDEALPDSEVTLPPDWALQDANDYWTVLETAIPQALRQAGASPEEVVGIGVDFTACTLVATDADGEPLSSDLRWRGRPHAWTKLWKHHAAEPQAQRINALARERGEAFLDRYGGASSSEWLVAKAWQTLAEDPEVYAAAARFIEGGDWLVWQLVGEERRSACQAGYKAFWSREDGYPDRDFYAALDPGLADLVAEKLSEEIHPIGDRAGGLTAAAARRTGLRQGTSVAVAIIDAHAAMPAVGVSEPGAMVLILGTSGCHLVLGEEGKSFPGICGYARDGMLPGFYGYEAGQPATGDILAWYVRHGLSATLNAEADRRSLHPHALLIEQASALKPGESGLLALDWWNGNRNVLMDANLSGMLLGLTLDTRPADIYRALIEGTAFGTRVIIDNFEENGIPLERIVCGGGLAERNPLLMQVYADVTGRPLQLAKSTQACALGSAILGAVAAGAASGGYDDIGAAVRAMGGVQERVYEPDGYAHERYNEIYREWLTLHDYFGRGGNPVMKRLREWRAAE